MKKSILERLLSKTVKQENGCWIWHGSKLRGNYGNINIEGKSCQIHRVSYELAFGEIPNGMLVLHLCDTPPCWNPKHLSLGTHLDNARDKVNRNRQTRGSDIPKSKLKESEIIKIRKLLNKKVSHRKIANLFGVGKTTITNIGLGNVWRWVK